MGNDDLVLTDGIVKCFKVTTKYVESIEIIFILKTDRQSVRQIDTTRRNYCVVNITTKFINEMF